MARHPGAEAVYQVADLFRERCLATGTSLLWPDHRAWTVATLDALWEAFIGHPDAGSESFLVKWRKQLAGQPEDVHRVAADVMALYCLFPSNMGQDAKSRLVEDVIGWKLATEGLPPEWPALVAAFAQGIGNSGPYYQTGRPWQIAYYLAFSRAVIAEQIDPHDETACRRVADMVAREVQGSSGARHILLHLLFPNDFERTASVDHKRRIVAAFGAEAGDATDLDDALLNIRRALAAQSGRDDVDFYDRDLRARWDVGAEVRLKDDEAADTERGEFDRQDVASVRAVIERICPDPGIRTTCLTVLADAIERAHRASPASWSVKLRPSELRLNVAWTQAWALNHSALYLVFDQDALDPKLRERIDVEMSDSPRSGAAYPSMPNAYGAHLPIARLDELLPLVRDAFLSFAERSAHQVRTRTHFYQSHTPAVIEYLREALGHALPNPDYRLDDLEPEAAWLFQANPRFFDLAKELATMRPGDEDEWPVKRYREQMTAGDRVVLWQGGPKAGIYALGELTGGSFERPTGTFWPDQEQRPPTEWAVAYRYSRILDEPILKSELQRHPVLRSLLVLRAPQGTTFKMTETEWVALQELLADGSIDGPVRWWIEKTETRGWDYRLAGELAVGQALVAPNGASDGRDVFHAMREARPGDVVLHLTDRMGISSISRVRDAYTEIDTPPQLGWKLPRAYVIRLTDHRPIDPPLLVEDLFAPPYREQLVRLRSHSMAHLFYSGTDKLELRSGANYITPAPPELVALLRDAYHELTGGDLVPTEWLDVGGAGPQGEPKSRPPTLDDLAEATHLDRADLEELEALILDKRQLVLEGPPGSGKTYVADLLARYFVGAPLTAAPDARVETVQFHQSYGYEDFVQGIRPVTDETGQLQYRVVPGIFARLCDLAGRNPDERFVLIVDEINRGNLSRIFGELLLLLEYRDKRVRLPFGGGVGVGGANGVGGEDWLSIPPNFYLIGTMNSTDRSLALIDYALRRRFYFYRLQPVAAGRAPVLERWLAKQGLPAADQRRLLDQFVALNRRIAERLSADFQVGHSYFMRDDIGTAAGFDRVWRRAVRPLLEEYFHGARDRDAVLTEFAPDRLRGEIDTTALPNEAIDA